VIEALTPVVGQGMLRLVIGTPGAFQARGSAWQPAGVGSCIHSPLSGQKRCLRPFRVAEPLEGCRALGPRV